MIGYVLRRILRAGTTLLGTTLIIFVLVRVVPADPAVSIAGPKADPETLAAIRKDLGLDDPVAVQYGRYLWSLAHGDLGRSYMTGRRVHEVIRERVPATALLAGTSLAIGFLLGLVVGIATAARRGSAIDVAVLLGTLIGLSIPTFWLGNLLIYQFSYRMQLLPLGGYTPLPWPPWPPAVVLATLPDFARHLVLPAGTLAIVEFFFYARFVHTNVGNTLASDYIRTARAKGVPPPRLYFVHALRNALIPIVTLLGLDVAALMSGVVLTETVFNWPGLGRLAVQAVFNLDIPLVAGTVLFSAVLVLVANLAVDLLYGVIDPRVQHG
jgi:peptide/nickel transport system permease protein